MKTSSCSSDDKFSPAAGRAEADGESVGRMKTLSNVRSHFRVLNSIGSQHIRGCAPVYIVHLLKRNGTMSNPIRPRSTVIYHCEAKARVQRHSTQSRSATVSLSRISLRILNIYLFMCFDSGPSRERRRKNNNKMKWTCGPFCRLPPTKDNNEPLSPFYSSFTFSAGIETRIASRNVECQIILLSICLCDRSDASISTSEPFRSNKCRNELAVVIYLDVDIK